MGFVRAASNAFRPGTDATVNVRSGSPLPYIFTSMAYVKDGTQNGKDDHGD